MSNITPATLLHCTTTTQDIGKYTIPKGSYMIANLSKINLDPKEFPEPHQFNQSDLFKMGN